MTPTPTADYRLYRLADMRFCHPWDDDGSELDELLKKLKHTFRIELTGSVYYAMSPEDFDWFRNYTEATRIFHLEVKADDDPKRVAELREFISRGERYSSRQIRRYIETGAIGTIATVETPKSGEELDAARRKAREEKLKAWGGDDSPADEA